MGALALFTGGRSLAGLGPEGSLSNTGLSPSAIPSGSLPVGIKGLHKTTPGLAPLPSLPDTPTSNTQTLEGAGQNHPPSTPGPLADWAALLHQASDTARQALQEVEPTLHNAQQAISRFKQTSPSSQTGGPSGPPSPGNTVSSLLDLSALLTARSILTAGHTHQAERKNAHATGTETPSWQPGTPHLAHPSSSGQGPQSAASPNMPASSTAPSPAYLSHADRPRPETGFTTHKAPGRKDPSHGRHQNPSAQPDTPTRPGSHPEHGGPSSPQLTQLAQTLRQLNQTLARHWGTDNTARAGSPQLTALPPAFTRLVRQVDAAAAPRHVTTHNHNTTHSPTVNVVVNAGRGSPAEIGRMARQGTAEALQRYQTGRVG